MEYIIWSILYAIWIIHVSGSLNILTWTFDLDSFSQWGWSKSNRRSGIKMTWTSFTTFIILLFRPLSRLGYDFGPVKNLKEVMACTDGQSWANSGLGHTKKMVWHKILRTQTKIGRTQLVGPPVHIPRRPEQMPDQKEVGLDLCQINFSWSGPDCYLPNSDSTRHPPTWVERTSFFAERENTRKCHSFLKKQIRISTIK